MAVKVYSLQGGGVGSTRSISLQDLPPSAWNYIAGHPEEAEDHSPQQLYGTVPWLYRAANLRAQALSDVPWTLTKGKREVSAWDEYAPLPEAPWIGRLTSLLYRTELALALFGSAYWLRTNNRLGTKTLDYRWLLPPTVRPNTSTDEGLTGFSRTVGGRVIPLTLDDVVYFWLPSITTEVGPGQSPAHAALAAAGLIRNIDLYADAFFHRGALKPTILTVEGNPPQPELDRLERWWKRVAGGLRRAWETIALRAGITVTTLGSDPKDLAMTDLSQSKQKDISVALGVPFTLLFSEASNRAVAQEDHVNLYTQTVFPECQLVAEILNDQIFANLGLVFSFQEDRVDIIKQYHEGLGFQYLALFASQAITREELRREVGMSEQPQGTTFAVAGSPVTASEASGRTTGSERIAASQGLQDKTPVAGTVTEKALALVPLKREPTLPFADGADAERAKLEAKHAPSIRKGLSAELAHALPAHLTPAEGQGATARLSAANGPLTTALRAMLVEGTQLGADVGRQQVEALWGVGAKALAPPTPGGAVDWNLVNSAARDWASGYAYDLVTQLDATTLQVLQQALPAYIDGTIDYATLVSEIADSFGTARAEVIATTEITRAFAEGNRTAWGASGVIAAVRWQTANDERVCPTCGPLNGTTAPLPGGFPTNPALHPRCRCWLSPVVQEAR